MTHPNKENIRKWVEALRGGKYEQTTHGLKSTEGFCCLGVACDISNVGEWVDEGYYYARYLAGGQKKENDLPLPVQEWLGINNPAPTVRIDISPFLMDVAELNDHHGFTFTMIADAIERTYLTEARP